MAEEQATRGGRLTEIHAIPLGFDTCYVLRGRGVIAIDAGQPNRLRAFLRGLERAAVQPDEVGLLLLTHAHWDHMGSAAEIRSVTGAPLAVHHSEAEWVEKANPPLPAGLTAWGRIFMALHRLALPLIGLSPAQVDLRVGDEPWSLHEFGIRAVVIPTPGHSPGSVSIVLESGEAFVGDLAMNRFPLTLSPSLSILGDDVETLERSWARVVGCGARTIYPAHGPPFPVEAVSRVLDI